ncbi:MAG: hypothetical protein KIT80_13095 [Chitinophagaceae bacterium]|nr:hypothetical protein [Chitinophagaceae bacterium]MCW5927843.1 hypothetical protein [Chitinophagaceae bacterium]
MNRLLRIAGIAVASLLVVGSVACKKERTPRETVIDSREYSLFNYSSGSQVAAGTFKLEHMESGNARLTIQLNEAFRQPQINFTALVVTELNDTEVVFAQLGNVPGNSGYLVVNPVISLGSNLPVKFTDLVGKAYYLKIMNGANVQATGEIR